MARIRHDTWRLRGLVSHADIRYDFFGIGEEAGQAGRSVALEQPMDFVVASALRRVSPGFYAGASALWLRTSASLLDHPGAVPPPSAEDRARADLLAPGVLGELEPGTMTTGRAADHSRRSRPTSSPRVSEARASSSATRPAGRGTRLCRPREPCSRPT
jgi:hypothetical protein